MIIIIIVGFTIGVIVIVGVIAGVSIWVGMEHLLGGLWGGLMGNTGCIIITIIGIIFGVCLVLLVIGLDFWENGLLRELDF